MVLENEAQGKERKKDNLPISLDNLLELLGNPTRRMILSKLAKVPHSASELAKTIGISRQAIHSQLKILQKVGLVENLDPDERGSKYRITSNISLRADITPDYYNVNYSVLLADKSIDTGHLLEELGCDMDYEKIKAPDKKVKFLGKKIQGIQKKIRNLENKRKNLIQDKECLIVALKNLMAKEYDSELRTTKDLPNMEKEIFYTLFYNPMKYFNRINIDKLLEDMFFSDIDDMTRDRHKVSLQYLLRDLSKFMDFFKEDEDTWFFEL